MTAGAWAVSIAFIAILVGGAFSLGRARFVRRRGDGR